MTQMTSTEIAKRNQDKSYPVGTKTVKWGHMTLAKIMAGADTDDLVETVKSGNNELTLVYRDGTIVCRLREQDIVTLTKSGIILIDTGGWNTPTTRTHVMNFLTVRGYQINMRGVKEGGGNIVSLAGNDFEIMEISFNSTLAIFKTGDHVADMEVDNV